MEVPSDGEAAELPDDCNLLEATDTGSLVGQVISAVRGAPHYQRFLERIDECDDRSDKR
jgi:hypothetical protein